MLRRNFLIAGGAITSRLALPGGIVAVAGCAGTAPEGTGFEGATMGTRYGVRLAAHPGTGALESLRAAVDAALAEVDGRMSTWKTDSELSRFNRARDTGWQALSPATARVVGSAFETSRASGGAFDATVGPLVDLWGFGPPGAVQSVPAAKAVEAALARVGWHQVEVDATLGRARKRRGDVSLDLSGIAKGYGVDAVVRALSARGVEDFLVEVGGELAARGTRPGGGAWRVAIERPLPGRRAVQRVVDLRGGAVATSGDYRNFFQDGGSRYAHTLDPRSGHPVGHPLASASVVAGSAMTADAASTTLMVLGPEAGLEWATARGLAAHFLVREGGTLRELWTPAFERHLAA